MDRNSDVPGMKITSNDGKEVRDTTLLKPGAKDSLSGENSTVPFEPSQSLKGPWGGSNKMS